MVYRSEPLALDGKIVLVFAAGGAVGSAVATACARDGAHVQLCGRRPETVASVRDAIRSAGGSAEADVVDALDERAVRDYAAGVVRSAGRIDAVFNAIGLDTSEAASFVRPSEDVPLAEFRRYSDVVVASQFLTARCAARHMLAAGRGAIAFLTATPARGVAPYMVGHGAGHAALEGLTRSLATEWGPRGLRVNAVRSGGMTETPRIRNVLGAMAAIAGATESQALDAARQRPVLKRMPSLEETANAVAWLLGSRSGSVTGAIINASCGEVLD